MVALSDTQKAQCRFHLGYNSGTPAGDRSRLENAMNTVQDAWTAARLGDLLVRCETAYTNSEANQGDLNSSSETAVTGDVIRTTTEKERDTWNQRQRFYLEEVNRLALSLGVRNYRDPEQAANAYLVEPGLFINSVPGADGTGGATWYTKAGVPVAAEFGEVVGDFCLNTDNGDLYEKVDTGNWVIRMNIKGVGGTTWYTKDGVPVDDEFTEAIGDFCINNLTGKYYEKTDADTWTFRGNLIGPTGPAGSLGAGPAGVIGGTWDPGATFVEGFDGGTWTI